MHDHPQSAYVLKHAKWQMSNFKGGGLGDKMEDWVEQLHQTGI